MAGWTVEDRHELQRRRGCQAGLYARHMGEPLAWALSASTQALLESSQHREGERAVTLREAQECARHADAIPPVLIAAALWQG